MEDTNVDCYVEIDRCTTSQSLSPDGDQRACATYENDTCSVRTGSPLEDNVGVQFECYVSHELKTSSTNTGRCTPFDSLVCLAPGFRLQLDQRYLILRMSGLCLTPTTAFPIPFVQPPPRCPRPRLPRPPMPDGQVRSDDKVLLA